MRWTLLALAALTTLPACGGPKGRPNLPPPEYEEPAAATPTASTNASSTPTAPPTTSSTATPAPH